MTSSSHGRNARRALVWTALALAALAGALYWWRLGVAVPLPAAPSSRIACVSYTPFRHPGESPYDPAAFVSPQRIDRDLKELSRRFDCVRTYSQGQGLSAVPEIAKRYGMHVLLGIWLYGDEAANAREVALGIRTALAYPDTVRAIVVGNEVLLRGDLTPARLVTYLRQVRAATHMPVTYGDVWEFWLRYAHRDGLARAVSFVTVHILPYWEDDPVPVGQAVAQVGQIYARVRRAFPRKAVLIGETGWPSEGKPRRGAVPSRVNEARYVRDFLRYAAATHIPYNLIESFDQPWKRRLEGTVGGYWGLFDAHANPKFGLQGPVVEMRRWWLGWLASGAIGLLFAALAGTTWQGRLAGLAAGVATGAALAEAGRQMAYAMQSPWDWAVGVLVCVAALLTALASARELAAWLKASPAPAETPSRGWRALAAFASSRAHFLWLVAVAWEDLLLVFDGRYRDYPVAVFLVPALALAIQRSAVGTDAVRKLAEDRLLATWLPLAALALLIDAHAANAAVWSWSLCNVLLAAPVLVAWARPRADLQPYEAQRTYQ
jgi:exo-beta-1,3-glucanase (GH17 family)